jgi:hypothetical protein
MTRHQGEIQFPQQIALNFLLAMYSVLVFYPGGRLYNRILQFYSSISFTASSKNKKQSGQYIKQRVKKGKGSLPLQALLHMQQQRP